MIVIDVQIEGSMFELTMRGHAEYAEAGKDIVCAAASMLFALGCERAGKLASDTEAERKSGHGRLRCVADNMEAVTALETVLRGFDMLAQRYPAHVQVRGKTEICPF